MKRVLLTGAALLMLASGSAMAADLARPAPPPPVAAPAYIPPPVVPAFTWTGLYVGLDGGYGFGTSRGASINAAGNNVFGYDFNVTGPLAGGFVGAQYQWSWVVVGLEADWQWADLTGNSGTLTGGGLTATISSTVKSYGSARARLGYAMDHWLLYGTAGWAWGDWTTSYTRTGSAPFTNSAASKGAWTAGAGIEYAFTNYLTGRIEYRYTYLGHDSYIDVTSNTGDGGNKVTISDVRAGLAFKFW